jgi:hypothetical protein
MDGDMPDWNVWREKLSAGGQVDKYRFPMSQVATVM